MSAASEAAEPRAPFVVGVDLGTSNCALSCAPTAGGADEPAPIEALPVPQVTDTGVVETQRLLPSFLYIPAPNELPAGALDLPWRDEPGFVVGAFAREHGGKVPDRLVSSAKSWLCHTGVDRMAPILPWGRGGDDIPRISPLAATTRYLEHLSLAWRHHVDPDGARGLDMAAQEVVLTVPASFDPSARELTMIAARAAGLDNVVLLEEPQAALYAWLDAQGDQWRDQLSVGDMVLVCDIGGGTTDFSLIAIGEQDGNLSLERVAVGDHILLGGDNMDWALAYAVKAQIEAERKKKLDAWQLMALLQGVRAAKEDLLGDPDAVERTVVIPNRGARLFRRTLKATLTREHVLETVAAGFFPACAVDERPQIGRRAALTQIGLPYASDPGITRHLAHFLTRSQSEAAAGGRRFVHPTALLFNGGVLQSPELQKRLVDVLDGWLVSDGGEPINVLEGAELNVAVARGASYYGQVRRGAGVRIRGGTARTYYVGVEQPMPAVPGFEPPIMAVTLAPFGMEEGTHVALANEAFNLYVGEPAQFRFFASSVRKADAVGDVLDDWDEDELLEMPPIETVLEADDAAADGGGVVKVTLEAAVTTVGTLVLECVAEDGRRWQLEFNVRNPEGQAPEMEIPGLP